jgi:hypothetical protein
MTIATTASSVTAQGDGSNTVWPFSFLIPEATDLILTVTLISDGSSTIIDPSLYSVTGLGNNAGGSVTYPSSGSPLSSLYNITIQRTLPLTQTTQLTSQGSFDPAVVEDEFDYLTMLSQQMQDQINRALAFPVGASDTSAATLITAILNGAANATAAETAAADAEAAAATVTGLLPLASANIADSSIISSKIASAAVTTLKLAQSALGQVQMINGIIQGTVATNALTVAIKTIAGTDPSSTDPVIVMFRDATAAVGDFTTLTLTGATSLTVPSSATLGTSNAVPFRVWIVGFNDAGVFRLGVINCSASGAIYPLHDAMLSSSTAISASATSAGIFYTGSAVTSKALRILGYLDFSTGQATAGTWATAPDKIQLFGPGSKKPGDVVQTVHGNTSSSGSTASATFADLSGGFTLAITPTNAANRVRTMFSGTAGISAAGTASVQMLRGTTVIGWPMTIQNAGGAGQCGLTQEFIDAPGVTTATTYKFQGKTNVANLTYPSSGAGLVVVLQELMG